MTKKKSMVGCKPMMACLAALSTLFHVAPAQGADGLYMVVDLSGGPGAASYPVSSMDAEPKGGWTDEYKTTKLVLRRIDPGVFTMGCEASEDGYNGYETVPHEVTISKPFYIGVFEVTQKQYELVTGSRPSFFSNPSCCETRPVELVTWNAIRGKSADYNWPSTSEVDASSFIGKLRAKTGIAAFDLPTEAAWEYACRAGTTGAFNDDAGIDALGRHWHNGGQDYSKTCTAEAGTAKVGSYRPNAWGLYDMHGNVWEWTLDWYQPRISFPSSPATDPAGPVVSPFRLRVLRGGGWYYHAGSCRSASRLSQYPDDPSSQGNYFGFRLCCSAERKGEGSTVTADFAQTIAKFRPALHSSSYAPNFNRVFMAKWDRFLEEMNFDYVRTHDLGLVNDGSRSFDVQYIFPLMHLDATKPENYFFTTTDFLVDLQHAIGQKTFYRLGTSIEHTGLVHFAAEIPKDFDKMAEVFAGTVRHFVKGWGDPAGKVRPIEYWEIWNEPDGANNMWSFNGTDDRDPVNNRNAERHDLFVKFFVKVLKRIKTEFPEVKVGGPALCSMRDDWFRPILRACKAEGVAPDFISWHCYGNEPDRMFAMTDAADCICREEGFPNLEFIMNEWHFMGKSVRKSAVRSPDDMNDINSACYSLTVLSRLQTSRYDQAYFYGCKFYGSYGFYNYETQEPNKNFYAMKAFGEIKRDSADICASASTDKDVTAFATRSADGKKAFLLVTDYNGNGMHIPVSVKGAERAKSVSARVLSFEQNLDPFPVEIKDGKFTLVKPDTYSAAFLVTFEF